MLLVAEQKGLRPFFDIGKITRRFQPWEREFETRTTVAKICKEIFPDSFVYIGGHHIAVHNPMTGDRMLMIEGTSSDFN